MARLPVAIQSYRHRYLTISAQRCLNWFAEQEPRDAKSPLALLPTPGLRLFATLTTGPIRGMHVSGAYLYCVAGAGVYKVAVDGTVTPIGAVADGGPVDMDDNGTQLGIVVPDTGQMWFITLADDTITQVTDEDFVSASSICVVNSFTICPRVDTTTFAISASSDMAAWDALDFASAETNSDNIQRVRSIDGNLWIFGERSIEIWAGSSNPDFPFERLSGGYISRGTAARFSVATRGGVPFWLGDDRVVYRAEGTNPVRISTHAIEQAIAGYGVVSDAVGFVYEQEGHVFYVLSFPTGGDTWVYDTITNVWHERESEGDAYGGTWRVPLAIAYGGAIIAGDKLDGRLYVVDPTTFDEVGQEIIRVAAMAPIQNEGKTLFFPLFELDAQTGVGLVTGQGAEPTIWLTWSDDGGRTWSNEHYASLGPIGAHETRVRWNRLGRSRDRVFRVQMSDPVGTTLLAANIEIREGRW